jgi:tetratricopeptide (TPR) repeat protein
MKTRNKQKPLKKVSAQPKRAEVKKILPTRSNSLVDSKLDAFKKVRWKKVFYAMSAVILVVMLALTTQTGITGDEVVERIQGRYALDYYAKGDTTCLDFASMPIDSIMVGKIQTTNKYYGVGYEIIPNIAVRYFGLNRYEMEFRRMLCALFGFIFMFFAGLIARRLQGWQTACLTLLIMFLTPVVLGLSFIDTKDIPMAAGYAIAILGMLGMYQTLMQPPAKTINFWQRIRRRDLLMLFAGIALAISIRIGGLMLLLYAAAGLALLFVMNKNFRSSILKDGLFTLKLASVIIAACLAGTLAGLCFYPNFFHEGIKHVKDAMEVMSKFPQRIPFNWNGQMVNSLQLPPYYLLKSYLYTIPLWVFAGAALFVLNWRRIRKRYCVFEMLFLIFTIIFPICYLIFTKANLYNGWRHSTFVYCSFAPLAAIGLRETMRWFGGNMVWKAAFAAIFGICMTHTAVWSAKNYKYAYTYYNTLAGNPYTRYDLDYHETSNVNLLRWLIKNKLTDTTKQYKVTAKSFNAKQYAASKGYSNIEVKTAAMRAFAATDADYVILSINFVPAKVLKAFFPPKGTIKVEYLDGNPVGAVVQKNPDDALGIRLIQQNRFAEGIAALERAYEYNPKNFGLWYWMGIGYYYTTRYDKAIEFFSKNINFWGTNEEMVYGFAHIGAAQIEQKKYDAAINNLQQSERINAGKNQNIMIFVNANMGVAYYHKKEYAQAIPYLEKSLSQYPHLQGALLHSRAMAR